MTGYHDIKHDIENSRIILTDYNQEGIPELYKDVLIEKVSYELEASIQAPRALVLTKLLSALSISLQPLIDVQTPDGRIIPVSSYFLVIAGSGERKSGVEDKTYGFIGNRQKKLDVIYAGLMRDYSRKLVVLEEKQKALKKELRKSIAKGEDTEEIERRLEELFEAWPECPRDVQLVNTDTTSEAFIDGMSRGSKYAAIASGEGGSVLRSAVVRDYPMLNSLWGGETVKKKRKESRSSVVVDGRLSISLDVQPKVFYEFLKKHGKDLQASGFFARFFMAMPSSKIGDRYFQKPDKREVSYEEYEKRLENYLDKLPDVISGKEPRRVIKLSEEAEKKMISIMNAIEHELNPEGIFCGHEGYGSKHADKILRLACLLNVFEHGLDSDIHVGAINHALHLGMYFAGQHRKIFKTKSPEEQDDALLLDWVNQKRNQGVRYIKKNVIRRNVVGDLRNSKRLNPALERLEQRGEVRRYMADRTECVDLMPWLPVDWTTAMSLGHRPSSL